MIKEEILPIVTEYFDGDSMAANVWIDKYAMKTQLGEILEATPNDMHHRLAKEFARIEAKYPNPLSEEEIFELLDKFKYIVPQGSPAAGIGNKHLIISLSNCFVIGNDADSYGGIMNTDEEQVQIMKRRGGVGHDLSHLRPSGAMANNAALNDMAGMVLYAQRYSNSTKEVRQGDRRGALMLSVSVKHPDTEKFIDAKLESGKITDANMSVRVSDEFMKAVKEDKDFIQTFPIDLKHGNLEEFNLEYNKLTEYWDTDGNRGYIKKVKAKNIWDKIIKNAHKSAEPGVLFWDTIIRESPADCYGEDWKSVSTNPCLTGETIVAVADGRNGVTIKELAKEGVKFPVYSARLNRSTGNHGGGWKSEIKWANAFRTGTKLVFEIVLSDGSSFKCTGDHLLATKDGKYVEAEYSNGIQLAKFYSFSEKISEKSYRHINSKSDGYSKQYRMIWEFLNGKYDGKYFNVDHINLDSTCDYIENLELLEKGDHIKGTKRDGYHNPIHKLDGDARFKLMNKRKCIFANASKYNWSKERLANAVEDFDSIYSEILEELEPADINVYLDEDIFVSQVNKLGEENVYDLTVDDNHNFYIITKTDDERYLNSSGVLVHNCGEIPLCKYDSCRLLLMNLFGYVLNPFESNAVFDFEKFKHDTIIAQRLMDDLVDLEIEAVGRIIDKINSDPESLDLRKVEIEVWQKIINKAKEGRRTGLGVTGEGDMLAALGLIYGTEEAISVAVEVHKTLAVQSYTSSIIMAEERGAFPIWDGEKEMNNPFLGRILEELRDTEYQYRYENFGRRNISNLTIPPAGTTSLMTQTTSGVEPVFMVAYKRRRRTIDKLKATFTDEHGEMFEEYNVFHHKFVDWMVVNKFIIDRTYTFNPNDEEQLNMVIKQSPYYRATSADVNWVDKVKMQGAIQKWVDHSISATTNIPANTTVDTVEKIYMAAYESGCKGMTIYREGSRSGILVSHKTEQSDDFNYIDAVKRPKLLECDIYHKTALKQDWMIIVGKLKGKPYEIFAFPELPNHIFPTKIERGEVSKVKSSVYKLSGHDGVKSYEIGNIIPLIDESGQAHTRKFSLMLRHHVDPVYIIKDIDQYAIVTSFDKVIQRVLRNYVIEDGEKCSECGGDLIRQDGCVKCSQCSWSKCG